VVNFHKFFTSRIFLKKMSQIPWVLKEIFVNLLIFLENFHYFFYIVLKFEAIFHQCFYNMVVLSNVSPIHAQFLLV